MFNIKPAPFVPYKNEEVLERCRNIKREDMEKHPNPDFKIKITNAIGGIWVSDMVARIMESDYKDKKLTMTGRPDGATAEQFADYVMETIEKL